MARQAEDQKEQTEDLERKKKKGGWDQMEVSEGKNRRGRSLNKRLENVEGGAGEKLESHVFAGQRRQLAPRRRWRILEVN